MSFAIIVKQKMMMALKKGYTEWIRLLHQKPQIWHLCTFGSDAHKPALKTKQGRGFNDLNRDFLVATEGKTVKQLGSS